MKASWCVPTLTAPRILVLDTYFIKAKLVTLLAGELKILDSRSKEGSQNQLRRIHNKIMKHVHGSTKHGKDLKFLWQTDLVLVPVHSSVHWSMVAMDFRFNEFRIYDSFYSAEELPYRDHLNLLQVFFFLFVSFLFLFFIIS
jgi:hypothetical protein